MPGAGTKMRGRRRRKREAGALRECKQSRGARTRLGALGFLARGLATRFLALSSSDSLKESLTRTSLPEAARCFSCVDRTLQRRRRGEGRGRERGAASKDFTRRVIGVSARNLKKAGTAMAPLPFLLSSRACTPPLPRPAPSFLPALGEVGRQLEVGAHVLGDGGAGRAVALRERGDGGLDHHLRGGGGGAVEVRGGSDKGGRVGRRGGASSQEEELGAARPPPAAAPRATRG